MLQKLITDKLNSYKSVSVLTQDENSIHSFFYEEPGRWHLGIDPTIWSRMILNPSKSCYGTFRPNTKICLRDFKPEVGLDKVGQKLTISKIKVVNAEYIIKDWLHFPPVTIIPNRIKSTREINDNDVVFIPDPIICRALNDKAILDKRGYMVMTHPTHLANKDCAVVFGLRRLEEVLRLHAFKRIRLVKDYNLLSLKYDNCFSVIRCLRECSSLAMSNDHLQRKSALHPATFRETMEFLKFIGCATEITKCNDKVEIRKLNTGMATKHLIDGVSGAEELALQLKIKRSELIPLLKKREKNGEIAFAYVSPKPKSYWSLGLVEMTESYFVNSLRALKQDEENLMELAMGGEKWLNSYFDQVLKRKCNELGIEGCIVDEDQNTFHSAHKRKGDNLITSPKSTQTNPVPAF